jgi:hypothetical protein
MIGLVISINAGKDASLRLAARVDIIHLGKKAVQRQNRRKGKQ